MPTAELMRTMLLEGDVEGRYGGRVTKASAGGEEEGNGEWMS